MLKMPPSLAPWICISPASPVNCIAVNACIETPVAPIDMTSGLKVPLLGLFGNDDRAPSPEQVDQHEAALKAAGKDYEFHRYDGAGHGFFYWHRPLYRPEQTMDGWAKVWAFFGKHLKK